MSEKIEKDLVRRRAIYFIGGYDPKEPTAFFERLKRETARFDTLWGVETNASSPSNPTEEITLTNFSTSASEDWNVETSFHFIGLNSFILKELNRPLLVRIGDYMRTFADYVFTGTAFQFVRHAWRFSLYFFYPMFMFLMMLAASVFIGKFAAGWFAQNGAIIGWVVAFAALVTMLKVLGPKFSILHLMDLWSFSNRFLHGKHDQSEHLLKEAARHISRSAKSGNFDEIILVGHSTGGALILHTASIAAELDGNFGTTDTPVTVLTVGSTALKVGLHPSASKFRKRVSNLFTHPRVNWVEYQCLSDVINFHRTNPAHLMGVETDIAINSIRVKDMVSAETYKRIKRNFFRIHYQFVFGNTKPYHYDFPAICFGPKRLTSRVKNPNAFAKSLAPTISELADT